MDLNHVGVLQMLGRKMEWLSQRQAVLSENVANADTPQYKPRDLTTFDFKAALGQSRLLEPTRTAPSHMQLPRANAGPGKPERERHPYETKMDGNAVVVEEQMLKISQTATDYNAATNLYRKSVGLLRSAIGRGGGA